MKRFTKYFLVGFIFSLGITSSTLLPMHRAQRIFSKQSFASLCKGANLAITFGPSFFLGCRALQEYAHGATDQSNFSTSPRIVEQFAYQNLTKVGVKNPEKVKILTSAHPSNPQFNFFVSGKTLYYIDHGQLEFSKDGKSNMQPLLADLLFMQTKINKAKNLIEDKQKSEQLYKQAQKRSFFANIFSKQQPYRSVRLQDLRQTMNKDSQEIEKALNQYAFAIQHEGIHIKEHHIPMFILACFAAPCLTHAGFKIIHLLLPFAKTATPGIFRSLVQIPAGFGKAIITNAGLLKLRQIHEKRADAGTENDPAILQGGIDYFESSDKKLEMQYEQILGKASFTKNMSQEKRNLLVQSAMDHVDVIHGRPKVRAEKLKQRKIALEKQPSKSSTV